jgi:hypothetical protein
MKLFSHLFPKDAPALPTLAERIAQLRTAPESVLLATALGTGEEELRIAAVRSLPDGEALRGLAGLAGEAGNGAATPSAALRHGAQSRLAELIDAGSVDFAKLLASPTDPPAMLSVAALCRDAGRLPQALAGIGNPGLLAQLAESGPSSRLRQLAAEAIEDPAEVRRLLKQVRQRDKNVYRILKQKGDAAAAREREAADRVSQIDELCTALERHSQRTPDATYAPFLEQLVNRWHALSFAPDADSERRALQAIERCRGAITNHTQQLAEQAAQQAAQQAALDAAEAAREQAEQAARTQAAEAAEAEERLRREAVAAQEALEAARAQQRADEEKSLRQLGGLIRKANEALSAGETKQAAALRRAIEERQPQAIPAAPHLVRQVQQLDEKLTELKQWKDFAVAPKRVELIAEMEALIGSTEEPTALAGRIKTLQQDWQTISKGILSDSSADWERFHRAAQTAYQPCRDYFEALAALRRENLERRAQLIARVQAFEATVDAEQPDWRLLTSVLREAPEDWRRHFPVDRDDNRPLQVQFDAAMARLKALLQAFHTRNAAAKQACIERVRELLAQEDGRAAVETVKQLQDTWKATGPAARDRDQVLWKEFRGLCDAVFEKRQQAYAQYSAGLEQARIQAEALCVEAERIGAAPGEVLRESGAKLTELRDAFRALEELPRGAARGLQVRFERALGRCEAQIREQKARDAEQSLAQLLEAAGHVNAYEWAGIHHAEASVHDALRTAAETFLAGIGHCPRRGLQAVKGRLVRKQIPRETDEAAEKALRMLCIRGEIRAETPTPPEDEPLRRAYQVQRLMRAMGQGVHAQDGDFDSLLIEWIESAAVAPALHQQLGERFLRSLAKLGPAAR